MLGRILSDGGPILWGIILLSVVGGAIVVERLLFFRRTAVDEERLIDRLRGALSRLHYDEALAICDTATAPIASLVRVGIENRHRDPALMRAAISDQASMEIPALERFIPFLGTIAHVAPLLGLLGTVTGNIETFGVLGGAPEVADRAALARGISEALVTTAAGIIVAIPAVAFYNYFVARISHAIIRLETRAEQLMGLFEPAPESGE